MGFPIGGDHKNAPIMHGPSMQRGLIGLVVPSASPPDLPATLRQAIRHGTALALGDIRASVASGGAQTPRPPGRRQASVGGAITEFPGFPEPLDHLRRGEQLHKGEVGARSLRH